MFSCFRRSKDVEDVEKNAVQEDEEEETEQLLPMWLAASLLLIYLSFVSVGIYLGDKMGPQETGFFLFAYSPIMRSTSDFPLSASFYFVFISITTTGFGDVMPNSAQVPFFVLLLAQIKSRVSFTVQSSDIASISLRTGTCFHCEFNCIFSIVWLLLQGMIIHSTRSNPELGSYVDGRNPWCSSCWSLWNKRSQALQGEPSDSFMMMRTRTFRNSRRRLRRCPSPFLPLPSLHHLSLSQVIKNNLNLSWTMIFPAISFFLKSHSLDLARRKHTLEDRCKLETRDAIRKI